MSSARYLYCIVPGKHSINFGPIGIGGAKVYSISEENLSVMIHDCEANPYDSSDEKEVAGWVLSHEKVVSKSMDEFGTVLPMRFNTIIQGKKELDVDRQVTRWLNDDYDTFMEKLEKLRGRKEYGVQVSWNMEEVSNRIIQESTEMQAMVNEIENISEGHAYLKRQKLENMLKKRLEEKADTVFKQHYSLINACVDDVKIESTKQMAEPKQMIINLSCLTADASALSGELDKIEDGSGLFVRFTGPWPPYSFVEG